MLTGSEEGNVDTDDVNATPFSVDDASVCASRGPLSFLDGDDGEGDSNSASSVCLAPRGIVGHSAAGRVGHADPLAQSLLLQPSSTAGGPRLQQPRVSATEKSGGRSTVTHGASETRAPGMFSPPAAATHPTAPGHHEVVLQRASKHEPLGLDVTVKTAAPGSTERGVAVSVRLVKPGSLAARGGIEQGDIISEIQGVNVADIYYKAQCLELLREVQVRLVISSSRPTEADLPQVVVAPMHHGPRLVVHAPTPATRKMTKDLVVTIARSGPNTPLGLEVATSQKAGGMEATVKHVKREGLAVQSGVLPCDRILAINDRDVSDLPAGSSGRIYLFRLLGVGSVTLLIRRVVIIKGHEDVHGKFTPREDTTSALEAPAV